MPKGTIFCDSFSDNLGEISFELTGIHGAGGPDFPVLNIRADVSLRAYQQYGQPPVTHPLSLITANVVLSSPEHRPVVQAHQDVALLATDPKHQRSTQQVFSFGFDLNTLTRIEDERVGKDLRVKLGFQLLMGLHHLDGPLLNFQLGHAELTFVIPRSQWVDNLLPALGYGGLEILEIRYGSSALAKKRATNSSSTDTAGKQASAGRSMGQCGGSLQASCGIDTHGETVIYAYPTQVSGPSERFHPGSFDIGLHASKIACRPDWACLGSSK